MTKHGSAAAVALPAITSNPEEVLLTTPAHHLHAPVLPGQRVSCLQCASGVLDMLGLLLWQGTVLWGHDGHHWRARLHPHGLCAAPGDAPVPACLPCCMQMLHARILCIRAHDDGYSMAPGMSSSSEEVLTRAVLVLLCSSCGSRPTTSRAGSERTRPPVIVSPGPR